MEMLAKDAKDVAGAQASTLREIVLKSLKHNTKQYTMFLALIAIWVIFSFLTEGVFLTPRNLSNLFVQTGTTAVLAIGMVLVIVAGHIDLSVGSVLGFAGAICAMAMIKLVWGSFAAVLATLGAAAAPYVLPRVLPVAGRLVTGLRRAARRVVDKLKRR